MTTTTKFAVIQRDGLRSPVLFGIGITEREAWTDAEQWSDAGRDGLECLPCTDEVFARGREHSDGFAVDRGIVVVSL